MNLMARPVYANERQNPELDKASLGLPDGRRTGGKTDEDNSESGGGGS